MLIGQTPKPNGCYVFLPGLRNFADAPVGLEGSCLNTIKFMYAEKIFMYVFISLLACLLKGIVNMKNICFFLKKPAMSIKSETALSYHL